MRSKKAIEETIRTKLSHTLEPPLRDQLLARALCEQGQSQRTQAALNRPAIGRTIMRNSLVKLAIAAAVIAVVGFGMLEFLGTGSNSGVVWADVAQKMQASRGVIFRSVRHDMPNPYDSGVDFSMDHYSSTQARLDRYKGGEIVNTMYNDCNTKTVILVDHIHKSYVKKIGEQRMPDSFATADPSNTVQWFLSCKHHALGRQTIDGVLCEGIETTDPAYSRYDDPSESLRARLWVSVETGYPVQLEAEYVRHNGQIRFDVVEDQFQWDVALDASLFEPNIPAGYIDISP